MTISDYTRRMPAARAPQAPRGDGASQHPQGVGSQAAGRLEGSVQRPGLAQHQAEEAMRQTRGNLLRAMDRARVLAAEALARAAGNLRGTSTGTDTAARRFADSLDRSATYLRQTDLGSMQHDAIELVRQYPLQALGAAFVAGVLIGQRLSRD